jgi:hypothetical protein
LIASNNLQKDGVNALTAGFIGSLYFKAAYCLFYSRPPLAKTKFGSCPAATSDILRAIFLCGKFYVAILGVNLQRR